MTKRSNDETRELNGKTIPLKALLVRTKSKSEKNIFVAPRSAFDEMFDEDDAFTSQKARDIYYEVSVFAEDKDFYEADWEKIVLENSPYKLIEN